MGMKYALKAGAKYIVQLNDDVRLTPSALSHLLNAAAVHPGFGILIPLQITADGDEVRSFELKFQSSPRIE